MDNERIKIFYDNYMSMSDYQIFDIYTNKIQSLTEEAKSALTLVISERSIDIKSISEKINLQDSKAQEIRKEKEENKSARDKKYEKYFFIFGIPIAILTVFLKPEQSVQNVFNTVIQVLFLIVIWYVGKYALKILRIIIGAITSR